MQFKVPQFLDIEDKIFGPFTFSEFAYLVGGAGLCYILFRLLGFLLALIPMLAVASFSLALVYYKPNSKPFVHMVESALKYLVGDKLFIWRRSQPEVKIEKPKEPSSIKSTNTPKLTGSRLRDLAWSLDVLDIKKDEY